jgi:phosphatidylglycerophosphate synthase
VTPEDGLQGPGPADEAAPRGRFRRKRLKRKNESAFDRRFIQAAKWMLAKGVHPNHFTFLQVPVFAFTIVAALRGWNWPFVATTFFVMVLDGGDGILARAGNLQSKTGAVLDAMFDTMGIAILVWGATQFFPEVEGWLLLLFLANVLLFLQNSVLGDKVVSYVRGPIVAAVAFPQVLLGAMIVATFTVTFLLLARMPRLSVAVARMGRTV